MISSAIALAASKKESDGSQPTYRFSGDAELLTQFIDRGLSITDKNPALNASFLFNLGQQFRAGFWGTNVSNVTTTDDNLWLKLMMEIHVDFSNDSIFKIYIQDDHFYKSDLRNGQQFGLKFDFRSYRTHLEWMNNYQGTKTDAIYFKLGKTFPLYRGIVPEISAGYTMQKASEYLNYLDIKASASYSITSTFDIDGGITAVSNSTQFNGRGDPAVYLGIKLNY